MYCYKNNCVQTLLNIKLNKNYIHIIIKNTLKIHTNKTRNKRKMKIRKLSH